MFSHEVAQCYCREEAGAAKMKDGIETRPLAATAPRLGAFELASQPGCAQDAAPHRRLGVVRPADSREQHSSRGPHLPRWLRPDEVATLLGLNRHTVYRLLRDREIPGSRIGGRWFVSAEALARRISGD